MSKGLRSKSKKSKGCKECNDELAKNGDFITCKGCDAKLHYNKCSGITRETWKAKGQEAKEKWRCPECRQNVHTKRKCKNKNKDAGNEDAIASSESESSDESDTDDDTESEEDITNRNHKKMDNMNSKDGNLNSNDELKELKKSVTFLSNEYDTLKKENRKLKEEMKNLREEMAAMKNNNKTKEKEIGVIQQKMNVQEQYERNRNIEIVGLKKREKEDLVMLMSKLAKQMKVENFETKQIDKIHRVPHKEKSNEKEENIVVQFKSRTDREEWIKKRKTQMVNEDILEKGGQGKIYVNEHLTGHQKYLLWKVRQRAKEANWKFVWIREGKVLCRKEEGVRCFTIVKEEDIDKIMKKEEEE